MFLFFVELSGNRRKGESKIGANLIVLGTQLPQHLEFHKQSSSILRVTKVRRGWQCNQPPGLREAGSVESCLTFDKTLSGNFFFFIYLA